MRLAVFTIILSFLMSFSAFAKPPASAFGQLPGIYDAAISPDGTKIATFSALDDGYGIGIFFIDGSGREPTGVALGKGVKPEWLKWSNNDVVLASVWQSQKMSGTPFKSGYLYAFDVPKSEINLLIDPKKAGKRGTTGSRLAGGGLFRQFNNVVVDHLSDDPDHILMSFSDIIASAPDVQRVNVRTGDYKVVRRGSEDTQYWYTDLRGEVRVAQGRKESSKEKWVLKIRDKDSDKWRRADEYPGLDADEDIFGFTGNPDEIVIGRYQGKNTKGLYIYDLPQKRITRTLFHNDDYDAGGIVYNADGSDIVGASYISDTKQVEIFGSPQTALDKLRQKYPTYQVDYIDSTADYKKVVVKLSHPEDPGALYILDTTNMNVLKLASLYDNVSVNDTGMVLSVRYTARDGQKIPAYVTLPPTVTETSQIKNLPFIVLPHGGPYARDTKRFDYLAQFFATQGYGVLQMNFRGSIGYGKDFEDAGRQRWVVMQEDVEDGMRWLLEKGYADPERTCIAGWSYGGYAALIGSIKNPELYSCTISMAGVTDLKDLLNDMQKYRFGNLAAKSFLKGFEDKDDLKANSPVKRASEMTGPVFLAHGTLDQAVHFDQYKRMKSALKKSSAKVTAVEFKDEDHYLSSKANRVRFFEELEKFLEKANGKSEYAAP